MNIANHETTIVEGEDGERHVTYADLIAAVVRVGTKNSGSTITEMRVKNSIYRKCDAAEPGEDMRFNSDETQLIRNLMNTHKWGVDHEDIEGFHAAVEEADA